MKRSATGLAMLLILCACDLEKRPSSVLPQPDSTRSNLTKRSTIAIPQDYPFPERDTFTVLSWNVEHLVDPYDNPYILNDREDDPPETAVFPPYEAGQKYQSTYGWGLSGRGIKSLFTRPVA